MATDDSNACSVFVFRVKHSVKVPTVLLNVSTSLLVDKEQPYRKRNLQVSHVVKL